MARAGDGMALVLLCRLAAEGIDRRRTIEDLQGQMPEWPRALLLDVAAALRWRARREPALAAVVEDLRQVPAFAQALAEVEQFGDEC
jgi:hypothetical protein